MLFSENVTFDILARVIDFISSLNHYMNVAVINYPQSQLLKSYYYV